MADQDSLFLRLGGAAAVNAAVDLFYSKVMADASLSRFFANTDMGRMRSKQKAFLTYAFGGAPQFDGRRLREAHARAVANGLGDGHFDAVAGHLEETLRELGVAGPLVAEVMAVAGSTRGEVPGR